MSPAPTPTAEEIERIVDGLTEVQRDDLTRCWDCFADADPLPAGRDLDRYLDDLEASGFVELVGVDTDALDDPFAYERGIEPGGMMWRLTPLGLAVRDRIMGGER